MKRVDFCFDVEGRRQLLGLLSKAAPALSDPCDPPVAENAAALAATGRTIPATPAEWIIAAAEEQIRLLRSAWAADRTARPATASNICEAISRLRETIKPFGEGWVDPRTAAIADWSAIDSKLAKRMEELKASTRREPKEDVRYTAAKIFWHARGHARRAGVDLDEKDTLRFVAAVLEIANVRHPDPYQHPARCREFILGDDSEPAADG